MRWLRGKSIAGVGGSEGNADGLWWWSFLSNKGYAINDEKNIGRGSEKRRANMSGVSLIVVLLLEWEEDTSRREGGDRCC